ncbi:haloacid dehalogenase-like hydrolase [Bradyrhizobium cytisi]|uniref:Haloacid dehalogenase-like hydrolase n=2 Tax=Bradyrhizobium cytisi TaxID=515489 RepID=A0A5S4VZ35_9BRAD|nr:haloacid dehalogenase-like hydrolase [Bradyrhizobium cytisi]
MKCKSLSMIAGGILGLALGLTWSFSALAQVDPLPSWNATPTKQAIVEFVGRVTKVGGPDFVAPAERIATFDNDGTLWVEQPMYVQLAFALDRLRAMAPLHPDWSYMEPFQSVLEGDVKASAKMDEHDIVQLIMMTHAGMTTDEFSKIVTDWLTTARDPRFKRPYTELVYQPMLELLSYLRANGFKTFIVSGGGVEFMRPWTEKVYGVAPEQVIGSSIKTNFQMRDGIPTLFRLPDLNFIDDKVGKPVGINETIGRRPIAAFGNSDGDLEMLQWTTISDGVRFGAIVHHTDAVREYAYDRQSHFGRLDVALDAAVANRWTVIDMKKDWKVIFPFDPR